MPETFAAEMAPLLELDRVSMDYAGHAGLLRRRVASIRAVEDLSFTIRRGETLALVGESGCGKSTTGRLVLRLHEPSSGRILFDGTDITHIRGRHLRRFRPRIQMIFQDPLGSLNPRLRVGKIIAEPLEEHSRGNARSRQARVDELLDAVGLDPGLAGRYPHELSGGQRQRIGIARALALEPELIVCDEPIAALDVSIQAQIVNLLRDLQRKLGLTYLFISHDLSMVRHFADRVAVMYLGGIVESAPVDRLFEQPGHPYTRALISAVPIPDPEAEARRRPILLSGEVPDPGELPAGCRFSSRCPEAFARCLDAAPHLRRLEKNHYLACHLTG